jgi:hypothetical protein
MSVVGSVDRRNRSGHRRGKPTKCLWSLALIAGQALIGRIAGFGSLRFRNLLWRWELRRWLWRLSARAPQEIEWWNGQSPCQQP